MPRHIRAVCSKYVSVDLAEQHVLMGYTEGWKYFVQLCTVLNHNGMSLGFYDWVDAVLCVPELRQVICEWHTALHSLVKLSAPIEDECRALQVRTYVDRDDDHLEYIVVVRYNRPATRYRCKTNLSDNSERKYTACVSAPRASHASCISDMCSDIVVQMQDDARDDYQMTLVLRKLLSQLCEQKSRCCQLLAL